MKKGEKKIKYTMYLPIKTSENSFLVRLVMEDEEEARDTYKHLVAHGIKVHLMRSTEQTIYDSETLERFEPETKN